MRTLNPYFIMMYPNSMSHLECFLNPILVMLGLLFFLQILQYIMYL